MSHYNEIDIACSKCGEDFRSAVWTAIHAGEDPELKELLLGGELNLVQCPSCAETFFYEHLLIYQEPALELVAYVYPPNREPEKAALQMMMKQSFHEAQEGIDPARRISEEPVLLFGLDVLEALLHAEEEREEQSDIAEAYLHANHLPYHRIRRRQAREQNSPYIIPDGQALSRLLELNPALSLYRELQGRLTVPS